MQLTTTLGTTKKTGPIGVVTSHAKKQIQDLVLNVTATVKACQHAEELPGNSWKTHQLMCKKSSDVFMAANLIAIMHLSYNDTCPIGWHAPGFEENHDPKFLVGNKGAYQGGIETGHHR